MFVTYFFFFNDTATTEIYTLSLHDALPISAADHALVLGERRRVLRGQRVDHLVRRRAHLPHQLALVGLAEDRKSTRLNSSHANISYAVFCLKKKKKYIYYSNRLSLSY